ncbi:hypothetical protein [Propionibacterium sp.]|uniref:hypothetical protein n=1 Tax=Propionibacterium sp. TaxID=1977903 RepID=UPI0039EC1FD2
MLGRLHHRGPEANGVLVDRSAVLGHSHLAIIDTSGGAQPLANENESLWVSFNGEIFNYLELAEELRRLDHHFRTRSETEVIVHAWEQWDPDSLRRLNGQ